MRLTSPAALVMAAAQGAAALLWSSAALASTTSVDAPWISPLKNLSDVITGPTAFYLIVFGIAGTAMMLLWGGELGGVVKSLVYLMLIGSILAGAATIASGFLGVTSSEITLQELVEAYGHGSAAP